MIKFNQILENIGGCLNIVHAKRRKLSKKSSISIMAMINNIDASNKGYLTA
jgi:hypothetical protein